MDEVGETPVISQAMVKAAESITGDAETGEYRRNWLYLGTLYHRLVQNLLEGKEIGIDDSNVEFDVKHAPLIKYLKKIADIGRTNHDELHAENPKLLKEHAELSKGEQLIVNIVRAAKTTVDKLDVSPEGYEDFRWKSEMAVMPSSKQVDILEKGLKEFANDESELHKLVISLGYQSLNDLISEALSNPEWSLNLANNNEGLVKISWSEILSYGDDEKLFNSQGPQQLVDVLKAVSTYYLFDVRATEPEDLIFILSRYRRFVAAVGAKSDVIGFAPKQNDLEAQTAVEEFMHYLSGEHFGSRPLLDVIESSSSIGVMSEMLDLIESGRVAVCFTELKSNFKTHETDGRKLKRVTFQSNETPESHYKDVAHTLTAIMTMMSRVKGLEFLTTGNDIGLSLIEAMNSGGVRDFNIPVHESTPKTDKKTYSRPLLHHGNQAILSTTRYMSRLMRTPHQQMLARLHMPVVDTRLKENQEKNYGLLVEDIVPEPEVNTMEMDRRLLRRHVARNWRRLAERLTVTDEEIKALAEEFGVSAEEMLRR